MLLKKVFLPEIQWIGYFDWFYREATAAAFFSWYTYPGWFYLQRTYIETYKSDVFAINNIKWFYCISLGGKTGYLHNEHKHAYRR